MEIKTICLIINLICLAINIYFTIHIFKIDRDMDKIFKNLDNDFNKKMKALTLNLTTDEALELIHEVVDIPERFYLGVNSQDILEVTLFLSDKEMPKGMGKSIQTFNLESYRPSELISFGIELKKYIAEKVYKNEL